MKKYIIFGIVILITISVNAQTIAKHANTIEITDSLTKDKLFILITEILVEKGYGILNSNKEVGTISTTEKECKRGLIRLNCFVKEGKIVLRGQLNMNVSININGVTAEGGWQTINYSGMKGSPLMLGWEEMNKVADALPGSKSYIVN